ncbi:MAG: AMP-binding protein, partial [Myxococcota bacterium]
THREFRTSTLFRERMTRVAQDCTPILVLVENLEAWRATMVDADIDVPVVALDSLDLRAGDGTALRFVHRAPNTPAVIQYTSGSTGQPRGVVLTHENIAANIRAIGITTRVGPSDRFVSWLPLHHDMGLIGGLLFPLFWHIPTHIMSPMAFLLRPITWLRAMQTLAGTMSVAPTFAYSLCCNKIPDAQLVGLDLSRWRLAFCGAEPVDAHVVRRFIERFGPHGFDAAAFYPVYGLAEATLAAAFPSPGELPHIDTVDRAVLAGEGVARRTEEGSAHAAPFVSVGRAVADHGVTIEDPQSCEPCAERRVGEIVVRGASISPRYYHEPESEARGALRTGDLGYVAEGRLFVIDRIRDLVIVRGQNFAPGDLERCAAETAGVRRGRVAAFSLSGAEGTEELYFVAELDARSWRRQSAIAGDLERRVLATFGLRTAATVLVAPGTLPRTTSGKIRRRACRDAFHRGDYETRLSWPRRARVKVTPLLNRLAAVGLVLSGRVR